MNLDPDGSYDPNDKLLILVVTLRLSSVRLSSVMFVQLVLTRQVSDRVQVRDDSARLVRMSGRIGLPPVYITVS
jgi:hypothetical protein